MDWYPWFPSLYEADTLHLTPAQDGLYRRLIDWYMTHRRPLPDDDRALAAICRVSLAEWQDASSILRAFFKQSKGMLRLCRCDAVLNGQDNTSKKRSEIARKGAEKRWGKKRKLKEKRDDAERMLSDAKREEKILPPIVPHDDFEKAWKAYPSRGKHPNPKKQARQKFEAAVNAGATPDEIAGGCRGYAEYCEAENVEPKFRKQMATFLSQELWRDYQPAAAAPPIVTPDCWKNGLAPVAARASPALRSFLFRCLPSPDGELLILDAPSAFDRDELMGRHAIELKKLWPAGVNVRIRKEAA